MAVTSQIVNYLTGCVKYISGYGPGPGGLTIWRIQFTLVIGTFASKTSDHRLEIGMPVAELFADRIG
jgi:hypothetical protein